MMDVEVKIGSVFYTSNPINGISEYVFIDSIIGDDVFMSYYNKDINAVIIDTMNIDDFIERMDRQVDPDTVKYVISCSTGILCDNAKITKIGVEYGVITTVCCE